MDANRFNNNVKKTQKQQGLERRNTFLRSFHGIKLDEHTMNRMRQNVRPCIVRLCKQERIRIECYLMRTKWHFHTALGCCFGSLIDYSFMCVLSSPRK